MPRRFSPDPRAQCFLDSKPMCPLWRSYAGRPAQRNLILQMQVSVDGTKVKPHRHSKDGERALRRGWSWWAPIDRERRG